MTSPDAALSKGGQWLAGLQIPQAGAGIFQESYTGRLRLEWNLREARTGRRWRVSVAPLAEAIVVLPRCEEGRDSWIDCFI